MQRKLHTWILLTSTRANKNICGRSAEKRNLNGQVDLVDLNFQLYINFVYHCN